ncbi:MAG: redoxin family protein [Gammaproteobacteria bacterium]|nr:redoxin family protein [Gammaproteobacteria bacterium]
MKKLTLVVSVLGLSIIAGYAGFSLSKSTNSDDRKIPVSASIPTIQNDHIIGSLRPDFSLLDVDGQMRNVSEWDGKVVAINFWATWCPPCIKEIPEFVELQHKFEAEGLQFIGIALQRAEEVTEFMEKTGMNYPVLVGEMEVIKIAESYGNDIGALPYTVILNREGRIELVKRGPLAGADAEAAISKLL